MFKKVKHSFYTIKKFLGYSGVLRVCSFCAKQLRINIDIKPERHCSNENGIFNK